MTRSKSLSVIIPVFNEEDYIGSCLDAIAAQTVMPDEVIVVDNNSSDETVDIAKRYDFVKVVTESRQGVVHARDRGFDYTKSELIGRIDADTLLPPNWVETVRRVMRDDTVFAATGPVRYYDMPLSGSNYKIDHFVRKNLYRGAPHVPFLFGSNMVLRRDAWESLRDEVCRSKELHEDLDLAVHLMEQNKLISYEKSMLAGMSSRRYNDDIKSFAHYMSVYRKTYALHDIYSVAPMVATGLYWLGYIFLWPVQRSFNGETRKFSLKRLLGKKDSRPHPM
ncbi:MAG: glycosyltransferase family 2 protein [Candidatus Saccharibacteria bacterium]|nr:glycosyltransferase family 2 protein [Candidatus Saccharibacteria bacterium]